MSLILFPSLNVSRLKLTKYWGLFLWADAVKLEVKM